MSDKRFPEWCGVTSFGGLCPVQGEGQIGDAYWYFRSRGSCWWITVHDDAEQVYLPRTPPLYHHEENYGAWPDAGYMPEGEAIAFIVRELSKWREEGGGR